jgi:hypothetical protein
MSRPQPVAALAAVTAALALAVPAANASAATVAPAAHTAVAVPHFTAGPLTCQALIGQLQFAELTGNYVLASLIGTVLQYSGCGGAAI